MDSLAFSADGISVSIDLAVGHLSDLTIERGGRVLRPLHRAPWIGEGALPSDLPAGVARLSGDFLCAPFSRSDVEEAPIHGWPANSAWEAVSSAATPDGWRAQFRLKRKVLGATVEKILVLRHNHPFLYQEHVFEGGTGAIPVAHHPMTFMQEGGRLSFSPKRLAITPADPLEPDAERGRYALAYPARSTDLHAFPRQDGGTGDLALYLPEDRREDFVTLVEADHRGPGWTAVARKAERDLVLVLKNPAELPVTMLWISNGGRDYAPWNGRHLGVLGIEDGRTAMGHSASLGDNPLAREGVSTAFALSETGSVSFRHVIGGLPIEGAEPPRELAFGDGVLRAVLPPGDRIEAPFDPAFLRLAS